jgi:hypothetical protein
MIASQRWLTPGFDGTFAVNIFLANSSMQRSPKGMFYNGSMGMQFDIESQSLDHPVPTFGYSSALSVAALHD